MLQIFNTLSRQKEEFKPIHAGRLGCMCVASLSTTCVISAMAVHLWHLMQLAAI